ncbi:MAG: tRNA pseudouridine(55) synthase TruB [Thiopseudomonas sp.]|nr:tRNA pseudouridine(55) synthase TruB [Thiopseudomonas sp.]
MNQQVKRKRRAISGILILDKPYGFSSNGALQKVRWLLNAEKGGHTGSLDPLATGVLPLCFGEATKFSRYLLDADKTYEADIRLGVTTDTADAEGQVLETRPVTVDEAAVEAVLPQFRGDILQVPPMYSALKKDGQPLYKLARAGEVVERKARPVHIAELTLLSLQDGLLRVRVACSKGTYIRSLAEDIGAALGCGAHVAGLRRTVAGPFDLSRSVTLDALIALQEEQGSEALDSLLLPSDAGLLDWPQVQLTEHSSFYWQNGQPVRAPGAPQDGLLRVYNHHDEFIGVAEMDDDGLVAPRRLVRSQ